MSTIKNFANELINSFRSPERQAYAKRNYHGHNYVFNDNNAPDTEAKIKFFNKEFIFNKSNARKVFAEIIKEVESEAANILSEAKYLKLSEAQSKPGGVKVESFRKFKGDKQVSSISQVKKRVGLLVDYETKSGQTKVKEIAYGFFSRDGKLSHGFKFKGKGLITHAEFDSKGEPCNQVTQISEDGNIYKARLPKGQSKSQESASDFEVFMPTFYLKGSFSDGALKKAKLYNQQEIKESGNFCNSFLHGIGKKVFPDGTTIQGNWDKGLAKGDFTIIYPGSVILKTSIPADWLQGNSFAKDVDRVNNTLDVLIDYGKDFSYEGSIALRSDKMADWFRVRYKDDFLVMRDLVMVGEGILHYGKKDFRIKWDEEGKPESIALVNLLDGSEKNLFFPYAFKDNYNYDPKQAGLSQLFDANYLPLIRRYSNALSNIDLDWTGSLPGSKESKDFYDSKVLELKEAGKAVIRNVLAAYKDPAFDKPTMSNKLVNAVAESCKGLNFLVKSGVKSDSIVISGLEQGLGILANTELPKTTCLTNKIPITQGVSVEIIQDQESFVPPPTNAIQAEQCKFEDFWGLERMRVFKGNTRMSFPCGGFQLKDGIVTKLDANGEDLAYWHAEDVYMSVKSRSKIKIDGEKFKLKKILASGRGTKQKIIECEQVLPKGSGKKPIQFNHGEQIYDLRDYSDYFDAMKLQVRKGKIVDEVVLNRKDGTVIILPVLDDSIVDFKNATLYFNDLTIYKGAVTDIEWDEETTGKTVPDWLDLAKGDYDPSPVGRGDYIVLGDDYKVSGNWNQDGPVWALDGEVIVNFGKTATLRLNFVDDSPDGDAVFTVDNGAGNKKIAKFKFENKLIQDIEESNFELDDEDLQDLIMEKLCALPFITSEVQESSED